MVWLEFAVDEQNHRHQRRQRENDSLPLFSRKVYWNWGCSRRGIVFRFRRKGTLKYFSIHRQTVRANWESSSSSVLKCMSLGWKVVEGNFIHGLFSTQPVKGRKWNTIYLAETFRPVQSGSSSFCFFAVELITWGRIVLLNILCHLSKSFGFFVLLPLELWLFRRFARAQTISEQIRFANYGSSRELVIIHRG